MQWSLTILDLILSCLALATNVLRSIFSPPSFHQQLQHTLMVVRRMVIRKWWGNYKDVQDKMLCDLNFFGRKVSQRSYHSNAMWHYVAQKKRFIGIFHRRDWYIKPRKKSIRKKTSFEQQHHKQKKHRGITKGGNNVGDDKLLVSLILTLQNESTCLSWSSLVHDRGGCSTKDSTSQPVIAPLSWGVPFRQDTR